MSLLFPVARGSTFSASLDRVPQQGEREALTLQVGEVAFLDQFGLARRGLNSTTFPVLSFRRISPLVKRGRYTSGETPTNGSNATLPRTSWS